MAQADVHPPLVWIDLEMTGLDHESQHILEIATVITNSELEILAEGPDLVIHQPDEILGQMEAWSREHHEASGLSAQVRASTISLAEAEAQTLAFVREHCEDGRSPLCGNSIARDRRFLIRHMPALEAVLHYRVIDVSTVKELCRRWYPKLAPFQKTLSHRALDDIRESIAELRHYREHVFR